MDKVTTNEFSRRLTPQVPNSGVVVAVLLLLVCGVRDGLAQAGAGTRSTPSTKVAATDHFEFHSDPWVNLHHFLYHWAREDEGLGTGRRYVPVPERSSVTELSDAERRAWVQAVEFYQKSVAPRSHFNTEMLKQKRALLELGGDLQAEPPDAIPGIAVALVGAMPVYRSRWWLEHDRANRAWIASVTRRLRRHEARFVEMTTRIYSAEWSTEPRRVDVSAYANPRAGYTAEGHVVMYSTDAGNQGLYGLEMLLHEVQHTRDVGSAARQELAKAFELAGTDQPQNLWHAVIFATAGAFVQSVAEQEGPPEHGPYWIREGFQTFQGWSALVSAVHEYWLPVVRGEASAQDGFAALAGSFRSH